MHNERDLLFISGGNHPSEARFEVRNVGKAGVETCKYSYFVKNVRLERVRFHPGQDVTQFGYGFGVVVFYLFNGHV